jgi:hypothetical protein
VALMYKTEARTGLGIFCDLILEKKSKPNYPKKNRQNHGDDYLNRRQIYNQILRQKLRFASKEAKKFVITAPHSFVRGFKAKAKL